MAAGNTCWGIELGAYAIKAIKLERDGENVKVLDWAIIPHKRPLSTPEVDAADALRVSMGQLVSQYDLTGSPIAISIPGHSAFARFAKLPPVEPKKIPDIVKFEAVQQIPFPIDQVEWDYQTFMSADNPDVEVGIFAVMREKVTEILSKWNEIGVTPDYVTIGPVAAYNGVAWDQNFGDKTPGTVILDIGTTATDLLVCEPGRVWVRTFQIGGHQFTEALVNAFKLSYSKAETLKQQAEQSKHARHILQAMRPVFSDIAQEVQRSLGYYQSSHRDANLTRLIALGSTFNLPGLRKYLGQQLQMEVIRMEKFSRVGIEGPRGAEFEAGAPNLATAYGLALQGLEFQHGIMVNLMPTSIVREQVWKKKTKWFALAAGLSLAGAGAAFYRPLMDRAIVPSQATKPQDIASTAQLISRLKNQWKTDVESKFTTDYRAANVALLLNARDIHARLVNDLGEVLKSASDKAAAGASSGGPPLPPLSFTSFTTNYMAPGTGDSATPEPAAAAEPGAGAGGTFLPVGGRIKCQLSLQTVWPKGQKGADAFVNDAVVRWLNDHSVRPGVPYEFEKNSVNFTLERTEIKAETPPAGSSTSGSLPSGGIPSSGPGGGGGGGGNRNPGGGGMIMPTGGDRDQPPPGDSGGGGSFTMIQPPASSGASGSSSASQTNLDQLAPLPPVPPVGKPGDIAFKFVVHFDAVIKAPAAPKTEQTSADPASTKAEPKS